jgi:hypothetical protein
MSKESENGSRGSHLNSGCKSHEELSIQCSSRDGWYQTLWTVQNTILVTQHRSAAEETTPMQCSVRSPYNGNSSEE